MESHQQPTLLSLLRVAIFILLPYTSWGYPEEMSALQLPNDFACQLAPM